MKWSEWESVCEAVNAAGLEAHTTQKEGRGPLLHDEEDGSNTSLPSAAGAQVIGRVLTLNSQKKLK